MPESRRNYATLDAIRGVAAIAVVLFHAVILIGPIAPHGYLAVDLFFVLSGFVIAHAYDDRMLAGFGVWRFIRIRLIRFYPLYLMGLGFGVIKEVAYLLGGVKIALPPEMIVAATAVGALFLPFPLPQRGYELFPVNVPAWSLFFEIAVNILYAVTIRWQRKGVMVVVVALSGLWLAIGAYSGEISPTARTLFSFTLGLLLYRARPKLPAVPVAVPLIATAALLIQPWGGWLYDLAFIVVASPLIVTLGAGNEPQFHRLARMLGLISFPLYAIHWPILQLAFSFAQVTHLPRPLVGWATVLGLLVFCVVVAEPLDRRVRRWLSSGGRRDLAETAAP